MNSPEILVVGAGGLARETIETIRAGGAAGRIIGVLDDDPSRHGQSVLDVQVIGPTHLVHEWPASLVVVCVASPQRQGARAALVARLGLPAERFATVIHPTSLVPPSCHVDVGSILMAHVVLTASVTLGRHVVAMPHCVLTHDDSIDDFATLAAGVGLAGGVHVGRGSYLGAGTMVREHVTIGPGSLVGMGSVVTRDVPANQRWWGSPARPRGERHASSDEPASGKEGAIS